MTVDTFNGEINKEMQKVADKMKGFTLLKDKKVPSPDNLPRWSFNFRHFDTEGQRRLGRRFAQAILAYPGPARRAFNHLRKNRKSKATTELRSLSPEHAVVPPVQWSEMPAVPPQQ